MEEKLITNCFPTEEEKVEFTELWESDDREAQVLNLFKKSKFCISRDEHCENARIASHKGGNRNFGIYFISLSDEELVIKISTMEEGLKLLKAQPLIDEFYQTQRGKFLPNIIRLFEIIPLPLKFNSEVGAMLLLEKAAGIALSKIMLSSDREFLDDVFLNIGRCLGNFNKYLRHSDLHTDNILIDGEHISFIDNESISKHSLSLAKRRRRIVFNPGLDMYFVVLNACENEFIKYPAHETLLLEKLLSNLIAFIKGFALSIDEQDLKEEFVFFIINKFKDYQDKFTQIESLARLCGNDLKIELGVENVD